MPSTAVGEWRPSRRGFTRSLCLRRHLGERLLRQKCKQKPDDSAAAEPQPPHLLIFLHRPGRATACRFRDSHFFTQDPNDVRYVLLRFQGRRVLWALSERVLHERCPRWLLKCEWKKPHSTYDSLPTITEPSVRALRTIMSLLHDSGSINSLLPASGPFDSPFIAALLRYRNWLDLAPLIDPFVHSILKHIYHAGGQYILGLKEWPKLMQICPRFKCQELFNMLSQRFIRRCELSCHNVPICQGIYLCSACSSKPTKWYYEFVRKRQEIVNEVLDFLQDTAIDFSTRPKSHGKQRCARLITEQVEQARQAKSKDGFTTTSLEDIVNGLRKDEGDVDSSAAALSRGALEQVAVAATKIADCRIYHMLVFMNEEAPPRNTESNQVTSPGSQ